MEKNLLDSILEQKAIDVKESLTASDYRCTYVRIQYGIKFTVYLVGRTATFIIYYKPKNNTWKIDTIDEWVNSELRPKINLLLGQKTIAAYEHVPTVITSSRKLTATHEDPAPYFEASLECLRILQPFEKEYIDFSIICEQVKIGIQDVLANSRYAYLDQQTLREVLNTPASADFSSAKEYLKRCLIICKIPTQL